MTSLSVNKDKHTHQSYVCFCRKPENSQIIFYYLSLKDLIYSYKKQFFFLQPTVLYEQKTKISLSLNHVIYLRTDELRFFQKNGLEKIEDSQNRRILRLLPFWIILVLVFFLNIIDTQLKRPIFADMKITSVESHCSKIIFVPVVTLFILNIKDIYFCKIHMYLSACTLICKIKCSVLFLACIELQYDSIALFLHSLKTF